MAQSRENARANTPADDCERRSWIVGKGHGSCHRWVRGATAQVGSNAPSKQTAYYCGDCGEQFVHWYATTPDIFVAMKAAGVPDRCAGARE
jgi:hypothetical protein